MHTSSGKKTQPSASCISASLRRALSIPCRQEFGCGAARILCHFCASTLAEQPASGCPTCLSVHCRAIFVLHRQAGTAGTNHCPCLQITRANKAPACTRTSSPENSPPLCLDRPCELQAWAVVRAGRTRLPMKQQRFLRCSASAKSHGSLLVCSDSCCRAAARRHNTRSSTASPRGMLCPAGLLLRHKHAQTTTAHASQSQRGCLPPSPGPRGRGAAR